MVSVSGSGRWQLEWRHSWYASAAVHPNNVYIMQSEIFASSVRIPTFTCTRKQWLIEQKWCIRTTYAALQRKRSCAFLYSFSFQRFYSLTFIEAFGIIYSHSPAFTFIGKPTYKRCTQAAGIQEAMESKIDRNPCQQKYNEALWHFWHSFFCCTVQQSQSENSFLKLFTEFVFRMQFRLCSSILFHDFR